MLLLLLYLLAFERARLLLLLWLLPQPVRREGYSNNVAWPLHPGGFLVC